VCIVFLRAGQGYPHIHFSREIAEGSCDIRIVHTRPARTIFTYGHTRRSLRRARVHVSGIRFSPDKKRCGVSQELNGRNGVNAVDNEGRCDVGLRV
jgi:hypothetical protein